MQQYVKAKPGRNVTSRIKWNRVTYEVEIYAHVCQPFKVYSGLRMLSTSKASDERLVA